MVFKANGLERIIKVGSINGEGTGRSQTVKMLMVENSKRELILLSILCPVLHIEHHNKLTITLGGRNYYLNFKEKKSSQVYHTFAPAFLLQDFSKYTT